MSEAGVVVVVVAAGAGAAAVVVVKDCVVEEGAGCSCRDWNTQERTRKASMRADVYS